MNGYATRIIEMAARPGGVCTPSKRQEYVFDGCMALLAGVRPGSPLNRVWQEVGALVGRDVVIHDELARIEGRDGCMLIVYADAGRLEEHPRELAPGDAALSHRLCEVVRRCAALDLPRANAQSGRDAGAWLRTGAGLLPVLPTLVSWSRLTWQEFAARYRDRFLRDAIRALFDVPDMPLLAAVMPLVLLQARDGGHPIGGSLAFTLAIEQRYRELGGQIDYGARGTQILVAGQRAVGVRRADGREYRSDYVESAADGRTWLPR
jgi:phytoene dehydrogenase-like protein